MLISRIFNKNKYQISYGFTGKFIGKSTYNTLWFLSPLQRLKYVNNMPQLFFLLSRKRYQTTVAVALAIQWYNVGNSCSYFFNLIYMYITCEESNLVLLTFIICLNAKISILNYYNMFSLCTRFLPPIKLITTI